MRNALFNAAGTLFQFAAGAITAVLIARGLGPSDTGTYSYLLWLVAVLLVPASFGIPYTLIKYIAELLGRDKATSAAGLGWSFLRKQAMATGVVTLLALASVYLLVGVQQRTLATLAILIVVPVALRDGFLAVLGGVQQYGRVASSALFTALAQVVCIGAAALGGARVAGMLVATLVAMLAGAVFTFRHTRRCLEDLGSAGPGPPSDIWVRKLWRFSTAAFYLAALHTVVWQRSEIFFLNLFSTPAQIAFYSIAFALQEKLGLIGASLSAVLLPMSSHSHGQSRLEELGPVFTTGLKYLLLVLVPLCLGAVALAQPGIRLVFGANYLPMVPVLQVLFGMLSITCLAGMVQAFLLAIERQAFLTRLWTLAALLNLALAVLLVPGGGALGAAVVKVIVQVSVVGFSLTYLTRVLQTRFPWGGLAKVYAAAGIAMVPLLLAQSMGADIALLTISTIVAAALYLAVLWRLGELGWKEWKIAWNALTQLSERVGQLC